jgi:3-deoxy-D-manno-octulosonate 8-phosphate phosphatase (KDO 8-P phosphatase)
VHGFADREVAYMGDDIVELPVLRRVGLSAAPADAVAEVRGTVDWVSGASGGRGAVRELVEIVLRAQGLWEGVVSSYLHETAGGPARHPVTAEPLPPDERGRRS